MLPSILFLGLRALLASASSDPTEDEEDAMVEDEPSSGGFPGFPGGKMPTAKELLGMLDSLDISDEEKESLRQSIMKQAAGGAPTDADDMGDPEAAQFATTVFFSQFVILMIMLSIIALIFGNFSLSQLNLF